MENKLKRAKEAYLAGIDSIDEYKQNKDRLEREIAKLNELVTDVPAPEPITREKITSVYKLLESSNNDSEKTEALLSIIDHIVYDKSTDHMQFYLKS